jgi:hypothetical protein
MCEEAGEVLEEGLGAGLGVLLAFEVDDGPEVLFGQQGDDEAAVFTDEKLVEVLEVAETPTDAGVVELGFRLVWDGLLGGGFFRDW